MRTDVLYKIAGDPTRDADYEKQNAWVVEYSINAVKVGKLCENYPSLQIAWDQFKTTYEICRSQDETNR